MDYGTLLSQFKLLGNIIRKPEANAGAGILAGLHEIVYEKIPESFRRDAPPGYYEQFTDMTSQYEQFENFVLYDKLIGKNVVALGGGFSSGKSSFLNAIDLERALPVDISPSTAVPTFIVNGERHDAFCVNAFDAVVPIGLKDIREISHGFGEITNEDGTAASEHVTLGHVLKSVFLASPKQTYKNLAFVDTPGFSKPDSDTYSDKTDESISRAQLNASSYILLFIQADAGTLKEDDINFIMSLRDDIPKMFIVSKADTKTGEELEGIVRHIRSHLSLNGIAYTDVRAFSSLKPDDYDAPAIRQALSEWNAFESRPDLARNFKRLFIFLRKYYDDEIASVRKRIERVNTSLMKLESEDAETLEPLKLILKESQDAVSRLKADRERLKEIKDEFFGELKRVGDRIGIPMPEPSEVEMVEEAADAGALIAEYMRSKNIKADGRRAETIRDIMRGVKGASGLGDSAARRAAIAGLIRENCAFDGRGLGESAARRVLIAGRIRENGELRAAGLGESGVRRQKIAEAIRDGAEGGR
jgi:GTP-binding protein EngB required for normal cell division